MSAPERELKSIAELRETCDEVECGGFTLQRWADGTYFVEAPSGEGTQVAPDAVEHHLAMLFNKHF